MAEMNQIKSEVTKSIQANIQKGGPLLSGSDEDKKMRFSSSYIYERVAACHQTFFLNIQKENT
jgi:hypothetical protein